MCSAPVCAFFIEFSCQQWPVAIERWTPASADENISLQPNGHHLVTIEKAPEHPLARTGAFPRFRIVVAHAGFEPAISALRGRCPGPLDECAAWLGMEDSNPHIRIQSPLSYH